jgi:hypothetical protein
MRLAYLHTRASFAAFSAILAGTTCVYKRKTGSLRVRLDSQLKLELHGAKVTSDTGLLACRELDSALGLTAMSGDYLHETRTGYSV